MNEADYLFAKSNFTGMKFVFLSFFSKWELMKPEISKQATLSVTDMV